MTLSQGSQLTHQTGKLRLPADEPIDRLLSICHAFGCSAPADDPISGQRLIYPFKVKLPQSLKSDHFARRLDDRLSSQDLARLGPGHQARSHIHLGAMHTVGSPLGTAISPGAHWPMDNPNLYVLDVTQVRRRLDQFQRH